MKSAFPYLHSSEIVDILLETANMKGEGYNTSTPHEDAVYGAGLLDLGRAVTEYLPVENMSMATMAGTSVYSPYVDLSDAQLVIPSGLADQVYRILPMELTAFDRYRRPFAVPMTRYVTTTHVGYQTLKNDVGAIMPQHQRQAKSEGGFSFSYAPSINRAKEGQLGFTDVSYKSSKMTSGFYFSENTKYHGTGSEHADLANPYLAFKEAFGAHIGYDLSSKYSLNIAAISGHNGLYDGDKEFQDKSFDKTAYGFNGGVTYKATPRIKFTLSNGMLYEQDALLGLNGEGAFGISDSQTYYTGISGQWQATGHLTLTGSYYAGYTPAQNFNSNMLSTTDLLSSGFALDANYKLKNGTDFGMRISSPLRVEHGKLRIDMASGRDNYSDEVYRVRYKGNMKPSRREYKLSLYGNKEIDDNLSISGEIGMRINPEHRAAANDYRALFGLSWAF